MLIEVYGDIWNYVHTHKIIIPTNQLGIMGAGLALAAKKKFPGIQNDYQAALPSLSSRAIPWVPVNFPELILAPTKRHWREKSRLEDVRIVLRELSHIEGGPFAIPEMGCGLGGLKWKSVYPLYDVFRPTKQEWVLVHPPNAFESD